MLIDENMIFMNVHLSRWMEECCKIYTGNLTIKLTIPTPSLKTRTSQTLPPLPLVNILRLMPDFNDHYMG